MLGMYFITADKSKSHKRRKGQGNEGDEAYGSDCNVEEEGQAEAKTQVTIIPSSHSLVIFSLNLPKPPFAKIIFSGVDHS